mmetsp:Transcript_84371/g.266334  ORF Transcript_84371/g.266334 Transcript_84371/m.266334 type:complete len:214 (-) Transcript_84371:625-1266(-)
MIANVRAVAPPGGWTQPSCSWRAIVRETASAPLSHCFCASPTCCRAKNTATPTIPPRVLPSTAFFGCASGALHALKTRTAMAPKGPQSSLSRGTPLAGSRRVSTRASSRPRAAMPAKEPRKLKRVSLHGGTGGPATPAPPNFRRYPAGGCAPSGAFAFCALSSTARCPQPWGYVRASEALFESMATRIMTMPPNSEGQMAYMKPMDWTGLAVT